MATLTFETVHNGVNIKITKHFQNRIKNKSISMNVRLTPLSTGKRL